MNARDERRGSQPEPGGSTSRRPWRCAHGSAFGSLLGLCCVVLSPDPAFARSAAAPFFGCEGCHNSGTGPVELELQPTTTLEPGSATLFTLYVRAQNLSRAGVFITADGVGTLEAGNGTQLNGEDVTHRGAAAGSAGEATFEFSWTPPSEPGGGELTVYAVAANGDNSNRGDAATDQQFSFGWGCATPEVVYLDADEDGFGARDIATSLTCAPRVKWSTRVGDCDDYRAEVYPDAPELCNGRDDDCDGELDEDVVFREYYVDSDGDGYGDSRTEPIVDCKAPDGHTEDSTDCDDQNAAVNPGTAEICDFLDNDCNDRVDDGARARCGTGWCERLASTCAADSCTPGEPLVEVCNGFDDDCDGVIDNGQVCPTGQVCYDYRCIAAEDAAALSGMTTNNQTPGPSGTTTLPTQSASPPATDAPDARPTPEPDAEPQSSDGAATDAHSNEANASGDAGPAGTAPATESTCSMSSGRGIAPSQRIAPSRRWPWALVSSVALMSLIALGWRRRGLCKPCSSLR